jgi:hypothetical protein
MNQPTARLAIVTAGALLLLALTTCGIPSYPYLYPPEALGGGRVGFTHNSDNNSTVFVGYEIYYRFYSTDPGSIGATSLAEQDMQLYFTSSFQISSIVYEDSSNAFNKGFRRAYIKETEDTPPQLPIESADINGTFIIEFILDDVTDNEIKFSYNSSDYIVKRSVTDSDDTHKSFLPVSDIDVYDFSTSGDEDIVADGVDSSNIFVAFYAVPYGIDSETLATLYANGSYEGMEYIGYFDLSY